jgi:hypothetical protein
MKKVKSKTKTEDREKVAIWLDRPDLEALRNIQKEIGVPISEQIRRFVHSGLEDRKGKK